MSSSNAIGEIYIVDMLQDFCPRLRTTNFFAINHRSGKNPRLSKVVFLFEIDISMYFVTSNIFVKPISNKPVHSYFLSGRVLLLPEYFICQYDLKEMIGPPIWNIFIWFWKRYLDATNRCFSKWRDNSFSWVNDSLVEADIKPQMKWPKRINLFQFAVVANYSIFHEELLKALGNGETWSKPLLNNTIDRMAEGKIYKFVIFNTEKFGA